MLEGGIDEVGGYVPLSEQMKNRPGYWEGSLTAGMIAQIKKVGGALWSNDSRYLFYTVDFNGRSDIYRLDRETGAEVQVSSDIEAPALLTIARGGMDVSPDGANLIYTGGKDGKIWLVNSGGGVAKRLAVGEGSQIEGNFSPDGKRVAYTTAFGETQIIVVADSKADSWGQKVSKGEAFALQPRWSHNSKSIFYVEYDSRMMFWSESRLIQTDLASGESKILKDGWGKAIMYNGVSPSPDGKWLAYITDENGWANIAMLRLATGESHLLVKGEMEFGELTWSPDGSKLAYTVNSQCNVGIAMTTMEGQTFTLVEGEVICNGLAWSPDGNYLSYVRQSVTEPTNLWLYDLAKSENKPLTKYSVGGLSESGMVQAEQVKWTSPDGLEIEGLLFKPEKLQTGKHPLLLHVHGGPIAQYNRRFDGSVQYWVNRGWVVIEPNFRGSTGYGRVFRNKLVGTWGLEDMQDNIGAITLLQKDGLIDSSRVVAWGASGGGYATLMLLAKWHELFKAGVDLVGVSNFVSFPEQTDRLAKYLIDDLLGLRNDNYALHEERSPVYFANQIKAPLLIMMGEADRRVPAKQGEEMIEALKKAGKTDYEYIAYPGEGHGWRKSETIVDYFTRMSSFLNKWVLDRG